MRYSSAASPFFISRREQLARAAAAHKIPAIYAWREFATTGGLMTYGADVLILARQAGLYAGRILKGEKRRQLAGAAADKILPVRDQPQDRQVPRAVIVPQNLLVAADEVIE